MQALRPEFSELGFIQPVRIFFGFGSIDQFEYFPLPCMGVLESSTVDDTFVSGTLEFPNPYHIRSYILAMLNL